MPVSVDQEITASTTRPKQPIDLEFTGIADQSISLHPGRTDLSCPTPQLHIGDQLVPRRFASTPPTWDMDKVWELPRSGTYRMRLWPCDNVALKTTATIVSAEEVELEYRTDTRINLGRRGSYGVARFATTAGKHIQFDKIAGHYDGSSALVTAPDGSLILETDFIAPETGTYKLWLEPGYEIYSYAIWRATESNN